MVHVVDGDDQRLVAGEAAGGAVEPVQHVGGDGVLPLLVQRQAGGRRAAGRHERLEQLPDDAEGVLALGGVAAGHEQHRARLGQGRQRRVEQRGAAHPARALDQQHGRTRPANPGQHFPYSG